MAMKGPIDPRDDKREQQMERQAKVLSLQLKRDGMLEVIEKINAEIYSEIKAIEHIERQLGIRDWDLDTDSLFA